MRIYATADIHGKNKNIEIIYRVIRRESPDVLVIAGDITQYLFPGKTLEGLEDIPIPILAIRGNSDRKSVETLLASGKNTTLLTHDPTPFSEGRFLGLNGTLPLPFLSKISCRETHHLRLLVPFMNRKTILVVHPPPRGICDKVGNRFSAGSFHLRRFIENHPPLMVLCGHIHEQAGYQFLKNTVIVNCAMNHKFCGAIIDYEKDMDLKIKMILNNKTSLIKESKNV